MHVLVTEANGVVGRGVVSSLSAHGHDVLGLVKHGAIQSVVTAAGGAPVSGDLDNPDASRHATDLDAVVHAAQGDNHRQRVTSAPQKSVASATSGGPRAS